MRARSASCARPWTFPLISCLASDKRTDLQGEPTLDLEVDVPADTLGFAHPEFLVETEWLKAHLGHSDLRILDCTVHIVFDPQAMFTIAAGRDDFELAHPW